MAAAWARVLGQTLQDALAFDRPGRFPTRDPITGEMTGWSGARAPLPAVDSALAAAFPGRSPRELLGALERGRGGLYDALRAYAKTAPRAAVGPGPLARAAGPGSRIGAAGLWDCRRTRPTFYACLADGQQFQRSPWGRLKVNPLPPGFGEKLRGLIRQGLRPRDAMREAWRRIRLAEDPERLPLRVQRRRYAMRRTAFAGANPGAAWHEGEQRKAGRLGEEARRRGRRSGRTRDREEAVYRMGQEHAHEFSRVESLRRGLNPQVSFDPFDYDSPAAAKKARDALYRQMRAAGHLRVRRSVLRGQLEKYRGLGVGGRGVRDVYYLTWEDPRDPIPGTIPSWGWRGAGGNPYPTGPVPARMVAANPRPGTLPRPWGYLTQEVRLHRSKRYDPATAPKLTSPQEVLRFVKNLPESDRERVFSIYVDQQNRVLGVQPLTVGGTTTSLVPTDALARGALLANATGVILVHNHPSGEPRPSPEDKAVTEHLTKVLPELDLRLLDHLVVGRREATSLKSGQRVPMPNPRRRGARPSRATYCPERVAAKGRFDPRSFRTVRTDGHLVTVGCPKGQYDARRKRCKVGTRAQRILHPPGESTCPLPGREVRPRRRRNPHMVIDAGGTVIASYGGHPIQTFRQAYARFRDDPAAAEILTSPRRLPVGARVSPVGRALMGGIPGVTKRNPPAGAVEIYRRVEFIGATNHQGSRDPGERFLHRFRTRARMLGLPDGSLLIQPAQGR